MVPLGPLFYRNLKKQKILGLKLHNGKLEANITLHVETKKEIYWWINNIFESFAPLNIPYVDITIYTDARLTGWGIKMAKHPQKGGGMKMKLLT